MFVKKFKVNRNFFKSRKELKHLKTLFDIQNDAISSKRTQREKKFKKI